MVTQAELEAQASAIETEKKALESELEQQATLRQEIEAKQAAEAQKAEELKKAQAQLTVIQRLKGDTARFEPFVKQAEERYRQSAAESVLLVESYNLRSQELGKQTEQYNIKVGGYSKEVEDYNKKQEEFGSYLQSVAEGGNAPDIIYINPYSYGGSGGDTVFGYSSSQDFRKRYGGGTSYWGEKFGKPWDTSEQWAIEGTKGYLGLGAEDVIYYGGKKVQESSFTPEQWTIALSVASRRQAALERYKQEQVIEQDWLKTGMLIGSTATFVQPASYIEAYKAIIGNAPPVAQVNVTPYVQSEEQLRAKAIMLSNPTAQFGSPDIYASEYTKIKERTAYPIEPIGTKKIAFTPAIEKDETGQIKFYGVEGAPGVQISRQANEARLAEINKQPVIITPNEQNIIITSPAPQQPEIIYNQKYGLVKRADWVKSAEQKIIEEWDKEAERLGLNTGWEGTRTRRASAYLIKKSTEAEEAITDWENELYMGAPDVPRILVGEATKAGIGIGTIVAGLPIIAYGVWEKPELMGQTIKTVAEPAVLTTPKATAEMITVPIEERGIIAGGVAIAGTVTGFYLGGKALGVEGKGAKEVGVGAKNVAKVVVSDIKRGATFPEGKVPAFPGYVWLKKTRLADGTVVIKEEIVDLGAREAAIEKVSGKPSKEGMITVVKPKAEVIDLRTKVKGKSVIDEMGEQARWRPNYETIAEANVKKPSVQLMTQTERDVIIADIKARGGLYQPGRNELITKAELNLGGVSGVKTVPIVVADQKGKAGLKTEAPTIQITRTGLEMETTQEAKATTISAAIQKGRTGQRQEAPQVIIQKQKTRQVPVLIAKTGLDLKTTQDTGQRIRMDTPTITKTTEITTPKTPQITKERTRRPPDKTTPPKKKPPTDEKLKEKSLDLGLKTGSPKIENPKKAGKDNPLYPASFEAVTAEEFQLGGKRAKHIRERKVTQELFEELKKGGRPIPTTRQFKKRKSKGKG